MTKYEIALQWLNEKDAEIERLRAELEAARKVVEAARKETCDSPEFLQTQPQAPFCCRLAVVIRAYDTATKGAKDG